MLQGFDSKKEVIFCNNNDNDFYEIFQETSENDGKYTISRIVDHIDKRNKFLTQVPLPTNMK